MDNPFLSEQQYENKVCRLCHLAVEFASPIKNQGSAQRDQQGH